MKKWLPMLVGVAAISGFSVHGAAFQKENIPGVAGDLILIEKNAETAQTKDQITVDAGDKIEITWSYPVIPASIPKKAEAKSSSDSVKFDEIRNISRPRLVGSGTLGAFFEAKKAGKSTLTFTIDTTGGGVILKADVTVR